ncbi:MULTISPECIES: EamA family transporter [Paenibacillus]|uniref:EamA domain-containing protein n=1 Tax=Paenibacillus borealis TaxID=160799 RepID=A0ABX3H0D9_PAEBO|nr:EamA family transporter [Paenibacillus borealis]OMD40527.1 hypothetical protein BSK56_28660 [Paenibacillus borealis]
MVLLLLNIIMLASGQILFKLGLGKMGGVSLDNAWKALFNLYIIAGLFLYVFATLIWFVVLSRIPLSVAYPVQSIAYVLGLLAALFIFNEPVTLIKWVGMAVIMVGVLIIAVD